MLLSVLPLSRPDRSIPRATAAGTLLGAHGSQICCSPALKVLLE